MKNFNLSNVNKEYLSFIEDYNKSNNGLKLFTKFKSELNYESDNSFEIGNAKMTFKPKIKVANKSKNNIKGIF